MASALSKRQQARNEKLLQELVQSVPGNNQCADCHARNPAWASWSLGVFLCMRCAAIHRKLGVHISKVKSLSMDAWSNEQVDNMRKVGNATSNKIYNPQNKKPPVPIDADEADSAMERFIRQKYINTAAPASARRHHTGSTESDETPPPLPPKTPSRFGFRSASSIFPLSSKAKKEASSGRPPSAPGDHQQHPARSPRDARAPKPFGASIQHEGPDATELKLQRLREMGFDDDQRNAMVLRGMGGNLDQTAETLRRLGEGGGPRPAGLTAPSEPLRRSLTPSSHLSVPQSATSPSPSSSTNPFDMLDMPPAQPQSSQSTGTLQNKNPYGNVATNPFGVPTQQAYVLDQALQNLSLSPSQPLFPHHTGGIPVANQGQQLPDQNPFQMQQTPQSAYPQQQQQQQVMSVQNSPFAQQNMGAMNFNSNQNQAYPSPMQQQQQPMQTGTNPFFTNPTPQQTPPVALSVNTGAAAMGQQQQYAGNPFMARSPTRVQSPSFLAQIPEQSQQQNFYNSPASMQQPWATPVAQQQHQYPMSAGPLQGNNNNPFFVQQHQQQQPMSAVTMPVRADPASIMALYNSPNPFQISQSPAVSDHGMMQQQQQQIQQPFATPQPTRSMTSPPSSGSRNPFMGIDGGAAAAGAPGAAARSRDSVLAQGLDWTSGRHSPDAFASLSARAMR